VAGGFLRLHVKGARADAAFGLVHPPPIRSIAEALDDHRRSGRARWLRLAGTGEADGPLAERPTGVLG
jgi:dihydroflavonol-4-reductase